MAPEPKTIADVTVLVVAYRHAAHVAECLGSIAAQSPRPTRVIIADDCSPDDTASEIRRYLRDHPEFGEYAEFHPNRSNIGLNPTLNKHLAMADTTYFTYISADDIMLPQRIERHVEMLEGVPDAALAYSDAIVIDHESNLLDDSSQHEFPWPEDHETRSEPFAELLERNWMPAASLFLRTEILKDEGGYREDLFYEDFELLVRLSKRYPFAWTEEALVGVRRLETSLGAIGFSSTNPAFLTALDAALRHYEESPPPLREKAAGIRWELAKRASRSAMPPRASLMLLCHARAGASSVPAFLRHVSSWALRSVRRAASSALLRRHR